jgi:hypothetical protein
MELDGTHLRLSDRRHVEVLVRTFGASSDQQVAADAAPVTGGPTVPLLALMQQFGGNRAMTALLTGGQPAPPPPAAAVVTDRPGPPTPLEDPNFNPTSRAHDLVRAIDSAEHTVELVGEGEEDVDSERRKIDFPVVLAALDGLTPSQVKKVAEVFYAFDRKATLYQCLFEGGETGRMADLTDDQKARLRVLMSGTKPDPVPPAVMDQLLRLEPRDAGQLKLALEYRADAEAAMHRYEADAIELHELLKDPLDETRRERVMELHRRKPEEIQAVDAMYAKNYNAGILAIDLNNRIEGLQRSRLTALRQGDAAMADAFAIEDKRQQLDKLTRDYDAMSASLAGEGLAEEGLRGMQSREQQKLTQDIQAIIDRNKQEALKEAETTGKYAGEVVAERLNKLMQTQVGAPGHTLGADLAGSLGGEDAAVVSALTDPWASGSGNLVQSAAAQLAADEAAGTTSAAKITATLRSFRAMAEQDLRAQALDPHTSMEQKLAIQRDGDNGVTRLAQRYIDDYHAAYDRIAGGRGRTFDQIVASADDADEGLIRNLSFGGGRTSDQGELDHAIKKRDVETVLAILRRQPNMERVHALEVAYNQLGTGHDLRETLFGSVDEGDGEYTSSIRPATAEEAMAGNAFGGLAKGRDAALVVEQLGKPTQAQLAGPDKGAAAKATWYAAGGMAEYGATWDNRGATGRLRQIGDDPETQRLLERSRDELAALKVRFDQAPEAERPRLLEEMRKLRGTLTGDAAAYEQDNARLRSQIQSALSFAVSIALAVAIPGVGAGLTGFLMTTAINVAATVASNFVIKAGEYGLADLKADVLGGILGAAGGKFGEELLGRVAQAIVKPTGEAVAGTAAKFGVDTVLAKEVGSLAGAGEKTVIQAEEFALQATGREAAEVGETVTKEAAETTTKEAAQTATKEAGQTATGKAPKMTLTEKGFREVGTFFGSLYLPKVLTIGDPHAAGEGGFAGLTIEELLKALATTAAGKFAHRSPGGGHGEEATGARAQEEPAGPRAQEEPAGPRAQEEPAGPRAQEEPAGSPPLEEPARGTAEVLRPSSQEILANNGIPPASADGFQQAANVLDVVIWVRPTNQASVSVLREGVAKPELIKAKTVNKADLLLGAAANSLGKVGFFDPVMPSQQILDALNPAARQTVAERFQQRREEYGQYHDKIGEYAAEGLVRVQDGVLQIADPRTAATPEAPMGEFKDIGGDHDLYRITDSQGQPIPHDVRRAMVKQLQSMDINVAHSDLVSWLLDSPDTFHQSASDKMVKQHETSEPLVVFVPKSAPRLALAGETVTGPPRTEGRGDRFLPAARGRVVEAGPAGPERPGETDFSVEPRHATPEEIEAARERDPVNAAEQRGGGSHPNAWGDTAIAPKELARIEKRLGEISQDGWDKVFASLCGEGRVHPLTEQALTLIYGAEKAAAILAQHPLASMGGVYIATEGAPADGHLFLMDGHPDQVAATVVHETTHYLQDLFQLELTKFTAEFQGWSAQREFLKKMEASGHEVPEEMSFILQASNGDLAAIISAVYKVESGHVLDAPKHVKTVMAMVRAFHEGAGPATTPAGPTKEPVRADSTDFGGDTQDIDPVEMERAALLGQVGEMSAAKTVRSKEIPYTVPPDLRVATTGQPIDLDGLNPNRRYLWIVDNEGDFLYADEGQGDRRPKRDRLDPDEPAAGETELKHGDLAPGPEGKTRGPARAGGQLYAQVVDGKPTGNWVLDAESSYMFAREDNTVSPPSSLEAVKKLLATTGTDVSRIIVDASILEEYHKKK